MILNIVSLKITAWINKKLQDGARKRLLRLD